MLSHKIYQDHGAFHFIVMDDNALPVFFSVATDLVGSQTETEAADKAQHLIQEFYRSQLKDAKLEFNQISGAIIITRNYRSCPFEYDAQQISAASKIRLERIIRLCTPVIYASLHGVGTFVTKNYGQKNSAV